MPRQWADVVFNAVDGWADCGAYKTRFPCHEPSGLAPECMLTAWLVDHGIPRFAFGEGTQLRELGIVRDYKKRQPGTLLCHLAPRRLSECAARAKNASRSKKGRGKEAIFSTGVGKQRLKRLGATGRRAGPPTPRDSVLQTRKTHTRPPCASEAECYSRDVALSTARTRQSAARKALRGGPLKGSATSAVPSLSISI